MEKRGEGEVTEEGRLRSLAVVLSPDQQLVGSPQAGCWALLPSMEPGLGSCFPAEPPSRAGGWSSTWEERYKNPVCKDRKLTHK